MLKRTKNKTTIVSLLKILWRDRFFAKSQSLAEIQKEIETKGFHYSPSMLSVALMRTVRSGEILSRLKKDNRWRYVQKYPSSSIINKTSIVYDFHPQIKKVSWGQFEDNHFKEAIQNALVEVVDQVKIKTNYPKSASGRDLDGDDLMNHVFGCDNQIPIVKFNSLATSIDKAEQRGIMNLFKGIVGIRDRKAHLNFIQNDSQKTIEYLSLASLLLRLLEENTTN